MMSESALGKIGVIIDRSTGKERGKYLIATSSKFQKKPTMSDVVPATDGMPG
jgi:hypothetical protein